MIHRAWILLAACLVSGCRAAGDASVNTSGSELRGCFVCGRYLEIEFSNGEAEEVRRESGSDEEQWYLSEVGEAHEHTWLWIATKSEDDSGRVTNMCNQFGAFEDLELLRFKAKLIMPDEHLMKSVALGLARAPEQERLEAAQTLEQEHPFWLAGEPSERDAFLKRWKEWIASNPPWDRILARADE